MKLQAGPDDRGLRLDIFLARQLDHLTRSHIQSLNSAGAILIQGRQEKSGYKIRGDEVVEVDLRTLQSAPIEAQHIPLQIYYEDDDFAVIEKPAGLAVHPGAGTGNSTLVHGLLFHFRQLSAGTSEGRPGIVHRLDKRTSGLLVVAKNDSAHARLGKAFHDRQVEKTYIALVHGKPSRTTGEIALNIGRDPRHRTKMAAMKAGGRAALTQYRVMETVDGFSLLEVKIKTGRTHQIRVHLSAIGHPVVGDNVYGERQFRAFEKKFGDPGRYFLHSAELGFTHPVTGSPLKFHSPLPGDLRSLLERIKE
jgi:23S rRNA pseudouridine1911/1915/1917 synthase